VKHHIDRKSPWGSFQRLIGPLLVGLAATWLFFALTSRGPLDHPLVHRYFAGHPINMIETALFFVGLAALALKGLELAGEFGTLATTLGDPNAGGDGAAGLAPPQVEQLLKTIAQWPARVRRSRLGRRLEEALLGVQQRGSAESLPEDLKYLAEADAARAQDSYALVRIVIWATPMLGFLGTVIGITHALGDLGRELGQGAAGDSGKALNTAMQGLLSGLYVAFDTTAIALCFSIVLMFFQFLLDRVETQLLEGVDQRAAEELLSRLSGGGLSSDPQVRTIQRLGQHLLHATEQLVQRQVELWQQSLAAAQQQWHESAHQSTQQMQAALAAALGQVLSQHTAELARIEQAAAQQFELRWEQWQTVLSQNARLLHAQQQELARQGELMTQAIRATGEVLQLEQALNQNLAALAGAKNFEDTVMSLAAAIHLLNSRLSHLAEVPHVALASAPVKGRAA
jgi:biopolymer transport protein ExbB/TolQ